MKRLLLIILLISFLGYCYGFKHHLSIQNDKRQAFLIESFGFGKGGVMEMNISNWKISGEPLDASNEEFIQTLGFTIQVSESDSTQSLEDISFAGTNCTDHLKQNNYHIFFTGNMTYLKIEIDGVNNIEGVYSLFYINCNTQTTTTFDLVLDEYNVDVKGGYNYLPIGLAPIPTLYTVFSMVFFILLIVWCVVLFRSQAKKPNKIHYLCLLYLLIQAISLLFESIEQHYIKTTGDPHGWNIAYYIFAFLQGSFFIVLILMFGSGWYFIKPYLSDKDKTIFVIVLPLQILDNIALIMVDEKSPGSIGWLSWSHLLTTVDLICFFSILAPILWSIKHLKDASAADDKAAQNLQKLKLFRLLYLSVITYAYFTRVFILLLKATISFKYLWLGDFFSLVASVLFYASIGYQFRPSINNPYFRLPQNDEEEQQAREMSERLDDE